MGIMGCGITNEALMNETSGCLGLGVVPEKRGRCFCRLCEFHVGNEHVSSSDGTLGGDWTVGFFSCL